MGTHADSRVARDLEHSDGGANLLVWAAFGGTVIGMAVWAIPAVLIALSVIFVWTNGIGVIILGWVLLVPVAAGIFDSIRRLLGRYVDWATSRIVYRALSPSDRATLLQFSAATPRPSGPTVSWEAAPAHAIAEAQRIEDAIRSIAAPDDEWRSVLDQRADWFRRAREVMEGSRPYDAAATKQAMATSEAAVRDLLGRRSRLYRVLTFRFVPPAGDD